MKKTVDSDGVFFKGSQSSDYLAFMKAARNEESRSRLLVLTLLLFMKTKEQLTGGGGLILIAYTCSSNNHFSEVIKVSALKHVLY